MKKTKNSAWKRVAAGALSMALVAGAMPANVGGFLTGGNALVASAEGEVLTDTVQLYKDGDTTADNGTSRTYHGTYADVSGKYIYEVHNQGYLILKGLSVYSENVVTITANETLPANYVIQNVTFHVAGGWGNVNESTVVLSSGTVTNYGQDLTIKNVNSKTLKLRNPGKRSYDVDSVSITYAEKTVDTPTVTAATDLTYSGQAQALVTAPEGATIYYRYGLLGQGYSDWSTDVPSAIDAGTYNVQWYSTANTNYAASGSADEPNLVPSTVVIGKADPAAGNFTFTGPENLTYDGNAKEATVASNVEGMGNITIGYSTADATAWDTNAPTNVGTYYVGVQVGTGSNYNSDFVSDPSWTFTIGRQSITPEIVIKVGDQTDFTFPYNTEYEVGLTDGSNPGNGDVTLKYAPKTGELMPGDDDNSWTDVKPTNAGTYWVKATVAETANFTGANASAILEITKAEITVTPLPQKAQELVYNETSQPLVNASETIVTPDDFKVKYFVTAENADAPSANADGWSTDIPQKKNAGRYQVWYKVDGNDNYNSIAPTSLGTVEIAKAKDTILTAPQFSGTEDTSNIYYYQDGQDIDIVLNDANGAHGQIEYAWKPAGAAETWVPSDSDWSTVKPKLTDSGTYTLLYRSNGAGDVNYDPSDIYSATIEVQGITTTDSINKFNAGESEILRLDSDINGNVRITRDGGIIDLNGHSIRGCLLLQNISKPIIVMNGNLGSGGDGIDDAGGYQSRWKGNVILANVNFNVRAWSGSRTFYTLGTTNIPDWRRERGGNRVNNAGLLVNFEDLHEAADENIKLSNQVRKAIKSIQIGNNNPVDFSGEANPAPVLFYEKGQTVKITSGARLKLTYQTTDSSYEAKETITDDGYVYTFTVPSDNSVTQITAQRWYEYQIDSVGDDKLMGRDLHIIPEQQKYAIASLRAEDHEYLSNFDNYVEMTIDPNFELKTESEYQYYSLDESDTETQLNGKPSEIGSYRIKTRIFVPNNGQTYWMNKDLQITRRNYTKHSGSNAIPNENEIKPIVTVGSSGNSYSPYNGEAQTPAIKFEDTSYKGSRTLERGTDYEIYMKQDDEYVIVTDDAALAKTDVGNYNFYVKFIGNYTSDNEYEPFAWSIISADIQAEGLAPTANTLTYNTAAQGLVTEGVSASTYGTTYYKLIGVEGSEWSTTIPTGINAGTYNVAWYIDGNSNYNDLGSETSPAGNVTITIAPKPVEEPRIELNGQPFVYDGTEKTYAAEEISVYDGEDLIDPSEYAVGYENNKNAGNDTAYVTVSDNNENGNYAISSKNKYFIIQKATPNVTIALASTNGIIYDGAEVETVYGSAVEGKDLTVNDTNPETDNYSVKYYADNNGVMGEELESAPKNVGTYWAVVTLEETANYKPVTDQIKFNIQQKDIACVTIEAGFPTADTDAVTPTGKEPTSLTVKDGETVLTDADFTAEFSDNMYSTNTAKITITGKGNYTGTKEDNYSVLTTLDISAVKDLITKIKDTNGNTINASDLTDAFVTKVGNNFTVYSKGKLQFSNLTAQPAQHLDDNGYFYIFNIPEGVNKCTVTHEYSYRTQQTPTDSIDNNGDVKITGYDSNVKSTENVYLDIVKVHFDNVYYLDNPAEKITVVPVENPAPGTSYEVISKKFFDTSNKEIDVSKPLNAGTYRVEVKIRVFYGVGEGKNRPHQDVVVKRDFDVLARNSQNVSVSLTKDRFVYDGTAKTTEITVTDPNRAENSPMVRGTDYEFGYYAGEGESREWRTYQGNDFLTKTEVGDYSVCVKFKGNYSGEKEVTWHITNATLPLLDIVPDEDLVYNHKAHQVKVLPKNDEDVIPEGSVLIRYGNENATIDQWDTLDENAPIDAGKYKAFIKLNDAVSYAFAEDQKTSLEFEVQKKNIESTDITFTYPQFSIQEEPGSYFKCDPITAKDGEYNMTIDSDFKVAVYETNKPIEDYPVLINGTGNYTGCTYLYWDLISESDAVKLSISEPTATVNASGNGRVSATFNSEVIEGVDIVERGILYVKDANCTEELTLENVGKSGIGKKESTVASNIGNQTLNVIDAGEGAKLRGYVTINYNGSEKTLYTNEVSGTYLGLSIDSAANVNISEPSATVNETSGAKRVTATFTFDIKDGYTIEESGILYVKDENCETELTLDNVGKDNIGKKVSAANSGNQTLNVTDNGAGAKLRGYVTVSADGVSKTFYSDEVSGNYGKMAIEDAATVNMSAAAASVNANTGAQRVSSTFTFSIKDGYSVVESGILYVKDAECATELTLENVGTAGIGNKVSTANLGNQTLNVTDSGAGAKLRGYVIVSDGTNEKTFYADEVSGTYADLSANG